MNIFAFSDKLQKQLKEQFEMVRHSEPITQSSRMMNVIQDALADLQQFIYNYDFENANEEIRFFKEVKPVLLSQYYHHRKMFEIALYDSFQNVNNRKQYYEDELKKLELFAKRNHDFYIYCMTNQTHLDNTFFRRTDIPLTVGTDRRFSTGFDDKFARLLAQELIKNTLNDMLFRLDHPQKYSRVNWTGNKTDAVELLVALQASGTINHGEVEMKQIVKSFEECFNVKLDNYYDLLKKLRLRKGGRSNFIDILKERFIRKIDQMEE